MKASPRNSELENQLESLIATPAGRRSFLSALPFLMLACGTPSQHRHREGDNTGQTTRLSVEDERRMTQEYLGKMQKDYPPTKDKQLQKYIHNLGSKIAADNQLEGKPYQYSFQVVETKMVNAFALPAGTVFVTGPLIAMAETEAELAGVVGHEIGHIQARHTAERMDQMERKKTSNLLKTLGGAILGAGAGFGLGKLLCPPKDNECLARVTAAGGALGAGGALLIQKYAFMANSREDEMEADRIGFRTAVKSGFDKNRVGDFYSKLYEMEKARSKQSVPILANLGDALSTHPPSEERVQQMKELSREEASGPGSVSSREFENTRDRAKSLYPTMN
jgi:predicted Zn-dependent protease